jgi:hypothetical protein
MPNRRKKTSPSSGKGGHLEKLKGRLYTLHKKRSDIYKLSVAKRSLGNALERKANIAIAHKACEDVIAAAEEIFHINEELQKQAEERDVILRELKRLDTICKRYTKPPTVKLYGREDKELSFWTA